MPSSTSFRKATSDEISLAFAVEQRYMGLVGFWKRSKGRAPRLVRRDGPDRSLDAWSALPVAGRSGSETPDQPLEQLVFDANLKGRSDGTRAFSRLY